MKIGRNYNETMIALNGYKARLVEYISKQKDEGYLLLLPDVSANTIAFSLASRSFVIQLICQHHISSIYLKTFIKSEFPEQQNYLHIPGMDIICKDVSSRYNGIAMFTIEQVFKDDFYGREYKVSYIQDINEEYFFHLDRYIRNSYA